MAPIDAGRLRHQVTIQKRSTAQDASGQPLNEWLEYAVRRAEKVQTPGREMFRSEQVLGRIPTVFRLRPLVVDGQLVDYGLLSAMRLLWAGKVFQILSAIDPDGMGEELLIAAEMETEGTP